MSTKRSPSSSSGSSPASATDHLPGPLKPSYPELLFAKLGFYKCPVLYVRFSLFNSSDYQDRYTHA